MAAVQLIIFDWDGTLMDSVPKIVNCVQGAARLVGLPEPSPAAARHIIGLSLDPAFHYLFPQSTAAQRHALGEAYKTYFAQHDDTPAPLFAGADNLIRRLHQSGKQVAIATGKTRRGLDRMLHETGLGDFFHASRTSDEAKSKPDPDMLWQLCKELGVSPAQALMIGDSVHDMAMAQHAGIARIGISHGAHDQMTLSAFAPMAVVSAIDELHALLLG